MKEKHYSNLHEVTYVHVHDLFIIFIFSIWIPGYLHLSKKLINLKLKRDKI